MKVNLRALIGKLNAPTRTALESAAGLCAARTNYDIEIEHLLLTFIDQHDNDFAKIARHFNLNLARHAASLQRSLEKLKSGNARTPSFSPMLMEVLIRAWVYGSLDYEAAKIRSGFIVIALLAEDDLSRIAREASPEMARIEIEALRRDFSSIVEPSSETIEEQASTAPAQPSDVPLTGGPRVFISYRHGDGEDYADSLFDRMMAAVPNIGIFRDTDTLKPGMVYSQKIDETLRGCDILIAIIGKKWLTGTEPDGTRRLERPDDWVRLEIAAALRHEKTVIPCLVGGAKMPVSGEMPSDISEITARHALTLARTSFRRDTEELIQMLRTWSRTSTA